MSLEGRRPAQLRHLGVVAALISKLALPLTVQEGSVSSFVSVAVAVSVPGESAVPNTSEAGASSPSGWGSRRMPATSKLSTEYRVPPESRTRTSRSFVV